MLTTTERETRLVSRELLPDLMKFFPQVTAHTALAAYRMLIESNPRSLPLEDWKAEIDQAAAHEMSEWLQYRIPFRTNKVGSEGAKEVHYNGKAAASVKGNHGANGHPEVWGVSDVVEGTTLAAKNLPGASSVLAVTEPNGIMPTPEYCHYMVKLIGPPQAIGIMSLDEDPAVNFDNLIQVFGIPAHELQVVTMNPEKKGREINWQYVKAAQKVGATPVIIDVGDFMPGVRAAMDPFAYSREPVVVCTRGGFEEGILAAAAARALGGFMEGKVFNSDPNVLKNNPVMTLKEMVAGSKCNTLLSASYITDDNMWFNQPGIKNGGNCGCEVTTMNVSCRGVEFQTSSIN